MVSPTLKEADKQSFYDRMAETETFASSSMKEKFNPKPKPVKVTSRRFHPPGKTTTTASFFDRMAETETVASSSLKKGKNDQYEESESRCTTAGSGSIMTGSSCRFLLKLLPKTLTGCLFVCLF